MMGKTFSRGYIRQFMTVTVVLAGGVLSCRQRVNAPNAPSMAPIQEHLASVAGGKIKIWAVPQAPEDHAVE